MNRAEKIAKILLDINAVTLNAEKPYKWVSGIYAPIYCDCRLIMGYPKHRRTVVREMASVIEKQGTAKKIDLIAGVETSGIPYAAWLADELQKPMVYVRKEQKDHGKENRIEGKFSEGDRSVLIEDLVSTAGTSISAINALREQKVAVEEELSIFTYEFQKAKENFEAAKINPFPLTNFSTLVKVASETGYLKEKEMETVLDFAKNPQEWGRKHGFA